ncbi:MAG TPA: KamA family radical SAM protein [Syntrophales bacterium]|jgi:lysine 2,3-aminomutase|nr:KamA family radical SAM protein [Syntrophales bacterium]HRT61307.1 KamA family radical SAM protein [Syntrophales bacterium]
MEDNVCLTQEAEPPGRHAGPAGSALDELKEQHTSPSVAITTTRKNRSLFLFPTRGISTCKPSARSKAFQKRFYPGISSVEWNDWQWQLKNRITGLETLSRMIWLSDDETSTIIRRGGSIPLSITPYYASLLDAMDPEQPVRRTVIPRSLEFHHSWEESDDPLGEESDSPVPGLVHRYPDRVLFLVTNFCSTYCRYCTRSRILDHGNGIPPGKERWEQAIDYIASTPQVRDVLLSGGDPLTMSDESIDWLLQKLRAIPHVELLRIGTKAPVVLPQRITAKLTSVLKRYHPLWMSIHFTHPEELTPEVGQACARLADAGIPLGSQTVLLAGINDDVEVMTRLVHGLIKIRVKPYYLYQCDPISGSSHFRTSIEKGLEIIRGLRGHTTGYAVPTYVIDAPGGGGKIPLLPEYVVGRDDHHLLLRNYQGQLYRYPDVRQSNDPGPFSPCI